ncbi:ribosome biosynthesis protein RRP14 SCDLUD_003105 [Saccharomycodes ludwigii]|nr:hypothetical protein SCDLUD_003105 [Saccharomycodes ludwigii]KAH3900137.1 hypothetical protein SCDLUD_003105 [Saccharomycodes ludwigii]
MKEKRKAPGTKVTGAPLSRESLLQQRKLKTLERKRTIDAVESDDDDEDDDPSEESDSDDDSELQPNEVIFQNIQFNDGTKITSDLQKLRGTNTGTKKHGPNNKDLKAHLKILEKKKEKLQNKNELELIQIKEKEKWQRAQLKTQGIKLKDNESLLRKALKRKEQQKRKSAFQWNDRKQQIVSNIAEKQKRREENLQIRKENKNRKQNKRVKMKKSLNGLKSNKNLIIKKKKNNNTNGNRGKETGYRNGSNNANGHSKRAGFEGRLKR